LFTLEGDIQMMADNYKEEKISSSQSGSGNVSIGGSVGPGAAVGTGASVEAENIAGRDVIINTGSEDVADAFAKIYGIIETVDDPKTAEAARDAVGVIQSENEKGDEANETSLDFSFKMLAQMAPDIFDVVVSTLVNPVYGISTVVQKIAQRAREEQTAS
jgi:hypothetical protein